MRKILACVFLCSSALLAQTATTFFFRAVMLPTNEVPATTVDARGMADIAAHVVFDSSGKVISGTVDFLARVNFAADDTAVGFHIHNGPAGQNAGVVLNTGLSATNSRAIKAGGDTLRLPVQVDGTSATALKALQGLLQDPSQYYVNIHTPQFPGGAIRGQLQAAQGAVLLGLMSSANETPPNTSGARGIGQVVAFATRDSAGKLTTGELFLQATYTVPGGSTFTGFHIHPGLAGASGPAILQAALPAGTAAPESGAGVLGAPPFFHEVDLTKPNEISTFNLLFTNPTATYINAHTSAFPGGIMRAQLRHTDNMVFPVIMDSANEIPTPKTTGTAPATVTLFTIRNEDGTIAAGSALFDVDFRLPGQFQVTGLHIHDAPAGKSGGISIPMIPADDSSFTTETSGFGNFFNLTRGIPNTTTAVATLEDISRNPENHYINIHTTVDPAGVMRAQLGPVISAPGKITGVSVVTGDTSASGVAPGWLIAITGSNLAKVRTDLSGWQGKILPNSLNGASVTIGGKSAPVLGVSPGGIVAQVPVDIATTSAPVVVNNGVAPSDPFTVNVSAKPPSLFSTVLKNDNALFPAVSGSNPAKAGDIILIYATGLQTATAFNTGVVAPTDGVTFENTTPVSVTVGGKSADVIYSIASPGFAGLFQIAVTIPSGASGGNVPVVVSAGTSKSNTINIAVQ